MVEIFQLGPAGVELTPTVFLIPELKRITEVYPDYLQAISFVAFMTDPTVDNPYGNLELDAREQVLQEDFKGSYKPTDKEITAALHKLEELNDTVINKYYRQVRTLVQKLGDWAETVTIDDSREGNMAHVLRTIKEVGVVVKQFQEAEKAKLEEEKRGKAKPQGYY